METIRKIAHIKAVPNWAKVRWPLSNHVVAT